MHIPEMKRKLKERQKHASGTIRKFKATTSQNKYKFKKTTSKQCKTYSFQNFKSSLNSNSQLKEGIFAQLQFYKQVLGVKSSKQLFQ